MFINKEAVDEVRRSMESREIGLQRVIEEIERLKMLPQTQIPGVPDRWPTRFGPEPLPHEIFHPAGIW